MAASSHPLELALSEILAPLGRPTRFERLTGGMFATTYRVTLDDGRRVVAKTAPVEADRLLTYEHDVLRTEALVYELAADHPDLLMPRVLLTDFTRRVSPTDVVVVTHLDGVPVPEAGDVGEATASARGRELGALMARLHRLRGPRFGYPSSPGLQAGTWPEAFALMVGAVLDDGARWHVPLPDAEIRTALARHASVLDEVTGPHLVHADLWPANLFVDPVTGSLTGVIDPERAFWGDPVFDFVGADPFGTGEVPTALVEGYENAGTATGLNTRSGRVRLAACRMYMALLMLVEIAPRQYSGDWVEPFRRGAEERLRGALDALGGAGC